MIPAAPLGYLAASLVFATFCTRRMVPLRALAITSNIAFIGYGYLDELWPILILHAALLPMNILRFRQAILRERLGDAADAKPARLQGTRLRNVPHRQSAIRSAWRCILKAQQRTRRLDPHGATASRPHAAPSAG